MRRQISNGAMMVLTALYLAESLSGISLAWATAAAAAVVLAVNLPVMGKTFRLPAWIFFLLGAAILLAGRAPLIQWVEGLNSMLKTAVILIVMQSLSLAMGRSGCESAVTRYLRAGAASTAALYFLIMVLAHLLASVMSLGSVVVILAAIGPALAGRLAQPNRFVSSSVSVGYCTLFLWAPGTVTVLMSMQVFSLDWSEYFLPAFLLAVLGLVLGAALAFFRFRGVQLPGGSARNDEAPSPSDRWKVLQLVLVLALIVAGVSMLEQMGFSTSTGRLLVVTLAAALVWLVLTRQASSSGLLRSWWDDYLPRNEDLSAFFLSMGVFSAAIEYSGLSDFLARICQSNEALLGPLVLPLLPLVIVGLSLVGIHPFVSVLMVGPILAGLQLSATPLQLGLAMSLGCCLSYMLSPFAGLILALSSGLKDPPLRICRENLGYALVYYILALGVILLIL